MGQRATQAITWVLVCCDHPTFAVETVAQWQPQNGTIGDLGAAAHAAAMLGNRS